MITPKELGLDVRKQSLLDCHSRDKHIYFVNIPIFKGRHNLSSIGEIKIIIVINNNNSNNNS